MPSALGPNGQSIKGTSGVEINGLLKTQQKMAQVITDLHGAPFLQAMRDATLLVLRAARQNAPRDRGQLVNSLTAEVRTNGLKGSGNNVVQGVVGSNVKQAMYQELGTGIFVGRPRYFPPVAALQVWARRHGLNAYMVARAIYLRGGLRPLHFLQNAFHDNEAEIKTIIGSAVSAIVGKP